MTSTPKQDPHVFLSYSWDNDDHKNWVRNIADHLLADGIDVTLDQYDLRGGQDRHFFMENGVRRATHVIIVCTPDYVERSNERERGVGEETSLITGKFYDREKTGKEFIPILRAGSDTPDYLGSLLYIDFKDNAEFESKYEELIRVIHEAPAHVKPIKGRKPDLSPTLTSSTSGPQSIDSIKKRAIESDPDDWEYNDERGIFTFRSDAGLQIRQLNKDDFEKFEEDWVRRYPDQVAYRDQYELV